MTRAVQHQLRFPRIAWLGASIAVAAVSSVGCGAASTDEEEADSISQSIENGTVYALSDAALLKNVRMERLDGSTLGSGALLRNNWVLTAAHLFPSDRIANPSGTFRVRYGDELITPSEIFIAPNGLDVALVRLAIGAQIDGDRTSFVRNLHSGTPASLVGQTLDCWGFGANAPDASGAGTLRRASLRVAESGNGWVGIERNASGQLMTTGDSGGVCFFGGQAIGVHNYRYMQVGGVMQRGYETHASAFRDWAIKQVIERKPTTIHRITMSCNGQPLSGETLISTANGYSNYKCNVRYKAQCIDDGSFDSHYAEWCDYPAPRCRNVGGGKYFCDPGAPAPAGNCTATKLHRSVLACNGQPQSPEEIIDLTPGYSNYTCGNRYKAQCVDDGSWDSFYNEWCEYTCN